MFELPYAEFDLAAGHVDELEFEMATGIATLEAGGHAFLWPLDVLVSMAIQR